MSLCSNVRNLQDRIGEMQLMTFSGLLEIMHICPLTLPKSMNINFGLITLVVWIAYVKLSGPIKEVNGLKLILRLLKSNKDDLICTRKWGLFNIIGGISKILFWTLDNEDINYYTNKITHSENEQLDSLKLTKEQIMLAKTTFRSINSALLTVSDNEGLLSKAVEEMAMHINEQVEKLRKCSLLTPCY